MEENWAQLQREGAEQISDEDSVPEALLLDATLVGLDIHWITEHEGICVAAVLPASQSGEAQPQFFHHRHRTEVPYRAGYLGFREVDAYLVVMQRVCREHTVGCVLVDGNGRLHPRRFGSACQFGLTSGLPTIGVAKNLHRCCEGSTERSVKDKMNSLSLLELDIKDAEGQVLGKAIRKTGGSQSPVFCSVGNRISLQTACAVVRRQLRFSVPEAVRLADIHARKLASF